MKCLIVLSLVALAAAGSLPWEYQWQKQGVYQHPWLHQQQWQPWHQWQQWQPWQQGQQWQPWQQWEHPIQEHPLWQAGDHSEIEQQIWGKGQMYPIHHQWDLPEKYGHFFGGYLQHQMMPGHVGYHYQYPLQAWGQQYQPQEYLHPWGWHGSMH